MKFLAAGLALGIAACLMMTPIPHAEAQSNKITQGGNADTGLRFWQWDGDGVLLRLAQLLPDQTRGYFEARGFDPAVADEISRYCVFQSMFKNTSAPDGAPIEFDLTDWRVVTTAGRHPVLVREHWAREWVGRDVSEAARIAFEWSLLPTRQRYHPGDYNWGMMAFGPPFGQMFDLEFHWRGQGRSHSQTLAGLQCSPDMHLNPQ